MIVVNGRSSRSVDGWRAAAALVLAITAAGPAAARSDDLSVDVPVTAAVTGAAAATYGVLDLAGDRLTPSTCRWCEPPGLDRNARLHLRWDDTQRADTLSNVLLVAVPTSLLVADWALAGRDLRRSGEDLLVVMESIAVTGVATTALKYGTARRRPEAWASGVRTSHGDDNSFVSGHASATFAGAAAFGTVARLRGYEGWPFVYAAGFAGATAVSYFRVAADRHWVTDVVAGAGLGTAIGVSLPLLLHRRGHEARDGSTTLMVTPMPLGVAGTF